MVSLCGAQHKWLHLGPVSLFLTSPIRLTTSHLVVLIKKRVRSPWVTCFSVTLFNKYFGLSSILSFVCIIYLVFFFFLKLLILSYFQQVYVFLFFFDLHKIFLVPLKKAKWGRTINRFFFFLSWVFSPFIFNEDLIIWTTDALEFAIIIILLKTDRVRLSKSVHFRGGTNWVTFLAI